LIYTTHKRQLVRCDVGTGKRQVVVPDLRTETILPAVNPDGKRVAVARLGMPKQRGGPDSLVVIVYDLDGKEVQRSPELVWRKIPLYSDEGQYSRTSGPTSLYWGPAGKADKLAIFEFFGLGGGWGLYDLKTNGLVVFDKSRPFARLPDSGRFLVSDDEHPNSIAVVDWDGKKHAIAMKELAKGAKQAPSSGVPWEKWDGKTFIGWFGGGYHVRIDTEKRVGVFAANSANELPVVLTAAEYTFPAGGVTARVIWSEGRNNGRNIRYSHLEVIEPSKKDSQVILEKAEKHISLTPAPSKKLLAIRVGTKILILNSDGKVLKEVVETDD